jgi:hypothetical protein
VDEVKCGKCGTDLGDPGGINAYLLCPRCYFGAMPQEHTQERDRRINEAALAIYTSGHYPGMSDSAIDDAERLVAAQDAAAQARP